MGTVKKVIQSIGYELTKLRGTAGYEKLKSAVEYDCNERNSCGCFNPNGCDKVRPSIGTYGEEGYKSCFHKYCDKFQWVMERANHYSEKTGIPMDEILNSWETDRGYWYMNYYQDANQPLLTGEKVRVFDTIKEMRESIGTQGFRCPSCGGVSKNPYKCDSGQEMSKGKVCNWNVGGLFGDLGKGVDVFCKDKIKGETIFMPVSWEKEMTVAERG